MWETQGAISNRTVERLATSDAGLVMLRELMFEEIEKVQRGLDPMGVVRDPEHAIIDTNLQRSLDMHYPTGLRTETVEWSPPVRELAASSQESDRP